MSASAGACPLWAAWGWGACDAGGAAEAVGDGGNPSQWVTASGGPRGDVGVRGRTVLRMQDFAAWWTGWGTAVALQAGAGDGLLCVVASG